MKNAHDPWLLVLVNRLYGWLLRAYPSTFRASYAEEMLETFSEEGRRALHKGGLPRLTRVSAKGIYDLVRTASAERTESLTAGRPCVTTHLQAFGMDLKYAVRTLANKPGFTALVVLMLALGIGGTSAIFSVMNAAVLRPLPFRDAERLVTLWDLLPQVASFGAPAGVGVAPPNYFDCKSQNTVFEAMALVGVKFPNLKTTEGSEQLQVERVSEEFFPMLGLQPAAGRPFLPEDYTAAASPVAVLSHRLWQQRFGADPGVLGRTLTLDGEATTVVAVLGEDLHLPSLWGRSKRETDLWTTLRLTPVENTRTYHGFRPIARLKPGVTMAEARAEMDVIGKRLAAAYPGTNAGKSIGMVPLEEQVAGGLGPALLLLLGAAACVLLIACVNVANLLLVRTASRRKELAVRAALGANRISIIRQLLTESLLLAIAGGGLGLLLAHWGVPAVLALIPREDLTPRLTEVTLDWPILALTLGLSGFTALLFGLAPSLAATRTDVHAT